MEGVSFTFWPLCPSKKVCGIQWIGIWLHQATDECAVRSSSFWTSFVSPWQQLLSLNQRNCFGTLYSEPSNRVTVQSILLSKVFEISGYALLIWVNLSCLLGLGYDGLFHREDCCLVSGSYLWIQVSSLVTIFERNFRSPSSLSWRSWHIFTWFSFCSCNPNEIINVLAISQVVTPLLLRTSSFTHSTFSDLLLVNLHPEHLASPSVITPLLNLENY